MKRLFLLIAIALLVSGCVSSVPDLTNAPQLEQTSSTDLITTSEPSLEPEPTATPEPTPTPEPSATPEPTPTPEPTATPEPTPTPEPTATENPYLFSTGTYLVNSEIQPGIYFGSAGYGIMDSCYWERLKDLSGSFDAIIANDNSMGAFYFEIKETDFAIAVHCSIARIDSIPLPEEFLSQLDTGMYIIGRDIQAGIYKGQAGSEFGDSCYWERMSGVSGEFEDILANDNSVGSFYVDIKETDFAFQVGCPMTPIESIPLPEEFLTTLDAGTYLIGRDIQAGIYKGQAGDDFSGSCYWERLSGVSGDFNDIIANDNATGQFYIEVAPTDFALSINCPVELVSP